MNDTGDDKAEIERLRGLLIDPGTPPWEDARAVLVAELRKAKCSAAACQVSNGQGCDIPSHIALNLIAQAARRPDAGDEDVERVAAFAELVSEEAIYLTGAERDDDQETIFVTAGQIRRARAALATMREAGGVKP